MSKQKIDKRILSDNLRRRRRKTGEKSIQAFADIYMQNICDKPFSKMHIQIFERLMKMKTTRKARLAIAAPRGHAKSTIVSLIYVLWCVLYKKEGLILIASNTSEQAISLLKDIKDQLKDNPLIAQDFPEILIA